MERNISLLQEDRLPTIAVSLISEEGLNAGIKGLYYNSNGVMAVLIVWFDPQSYRLTGRKTPTYLLTWSAEWFMLTFFFLLGCVWRRRRRVSKYLDVLRPVNHYGYIRAKKKKKNVCYVTSFFYASIIFSQKRNLIFNTSACVRTDICRFIQIPSSCAKSGV